MARQVDTEFVHRISDPWGIPVTPNCLEVVLVLVWGRSVLSTPQEDLNHAKSQAE